MSFPVTQWQIITRMQAGGAAGSDALGELASIYAAPLLGFAKRQYPGEAREEYEDMIQGFLCACVRKGTLAAADPERGSFRSFLITCFRHYVSNVRRAEGAQKRSPGEYLLSLDAILEERGQVAEPQASETPDEAFNRVYFAVMLGRAIKQVVEEWTRIDQKVKLDLFKRRLDDRDDYFSLADEFDLGSPKTAEAIYRSARSDLRGVLRDILATGSDIETAKAEAEYILATAVPE